MAVNTVSVQAENRYNIALEVCIVSGTTGVIPTGVLIVARLKTSTQLEKQHHSERVEPKRSNAHTMGGAPLVPLVPLDRLDRLD